MAPTLYMTQLSPPVRSVLLCAKASNITLNFKEVDLVKVEHLSPEYLKLNPQHTVPALDDDGFVFWDSHAIMAYLVEKYGKDKSLYPADLKKRAVIDQRLHFDSSVLFIKGVLICKAILRAGRTYVTDEEKAGLLEAYDFVEQFLDGKKWIAGDELSIADFSYATSLSSWKFFQPFDKSTHPRLSAWMKQIEALPYYQEANGVGLKKFEDLFNSKLDKK